MSDHPNAPGAPDEAPPRVPAQPAAAPAKLVQPWSQEAEESVVGGILLYAKAYPKVRQLVDPGDFYHPALKVIYRAMVELAEASKPIDSITVAEQMRANDTFGRLRAFNGESYFAELVSKVVTVENIGYHAKIVAGKATVRRVIETAQEVAQEGYGEYVDVDEYTARSLRRFAEVTRGRARSGLATQEESVRAARADIAAAYKARREGNQGPALTTGFRDLNGILAGGWRQEYIVLGARPSQGKTSLAMDWVEAAAAWGDCAVLVLSLEMKHRALLQRRISTRTGINGYALRSGDLSLDDWKRIDRAASDLAPLPIWYDDSTRNLQRLLATARSWANDPDQGGKRKRRLIVTDYVQLIEQEAERGRFGNRHQEVSAASAALKGLVTDCDATVIALSQLSRGVEERDPPRPRASDTKESGSLEENADALLLLYREEHYRKDTAAIYEASADERYPAVEVIIAKQRNGPPGTRYLGWDGARTHFFDLPAGWTPPEPVTAPRHRRGRTGNPHSRGGDDE